MSNKIYTVKELFESAGPEWNWLAQDEDGDICLFIDKPMLYKDDGEHVWGYGCSFWKDITVCIPEEGHTHIRKIDWAPITDFRYMIISREEALK